ncbi:hypothetical protein PAPYR_8416 [Paratrimastix pyriformis]|uniref:Uncharacterized protein n=1 Tax=Paratrimastix pyriformis TaxID=342808 RepID=A0ABQ8UET7_9EUKA|nr:hypothetical protein PAPYR_8416 [Paratrimastix pyriformis]
MQQGTDGDSGCSARQNVEADLLKMLDEVASQSQQLAAYQEASYQWHVKHHEKLKEILHTVNELTHLLSRCGLRTNELMPAEGGPCTTEKEPFTAVATPVSSLPPPPPRMLPTHNFHDFVMSFRANPSDPRLVEAMKNITREQFAMLEDSSVEFLLPPVVSWLADPETRMQAIVFIFEALRGFAAVFRRPRLRPTLTLCAGTLQELLAQGEVSLDTCGVTREELAEMIRNIQGHLK